jgi:hypothetical protein
VFIERQIGRIGIEPMWGMDFRLNKKTRPPARMDETERDKSVIDLDDRKRADSGLSRLLSDRG